MRHEESRVAEGMGRKMKEKRSGKMSDGWQEENGESDREREM